jgi:hypothetical protein
MSHYQSMPFEYVVSWQESILFIVLKGSVNSTHFNKIQTCRKTAGDLIGAKPIRLVLFCCSDLVEISSEMTDLVNGWLEEIREKGCVVRMSGVSTDVRNRLAEQSVLRPGEFVESAREVILMVAPITVGRSRSARLRAA